MSGRLFHGVQDCLHDQCCGSGTRSESETQEKFVIGKPALTETGRVLSIGDGIARVYGLKNIQVCWFLFYFRTIQIHDVQSLHFICMSVIHANLFVVTCKYLIHRIRQWFIGYESDFFSFHGMLTSYSGGTCSWGGGGRLMDY